MCWMQLLTAAFVAVLFLQAGFDMLFDREGNAGFLREHFKNSSLVGQVDRMLTAVPRSACGQELRAFSRNHRHGA